MNVLETTLIIGAGSFLAGLLGSLTGLGGGIVIVPLLTIIFHVDIRYAIGASLISVIATSSGAASAYVKEGITNIRIGMFLEIATTLGALFGAFMAGIVSTQSIAIIFGVVLLYSAYITSRKKEEHIANKKDSLALKLRLNGDYPSGGKVISYSAQKVPQGFSMMFVAGTLSGLLGIGSGAAKVIAMDHFMSLPFKVSTTTSNFMIGVTAAASAGIYLSRGYIDPFLSAPVFLGVLVGSLLGTKFLVRSDTNKLRIIFAFVVAVLAIEMIVNGILGKI